MVKMKFNLLQILTMNSLNIKHQVKYSNQLTPVSLLAFMKTLKNDTSEAYKLQVDSAKIQSLILMIKMI